jgi:hypothetical protein
MMDRTLSKSGVGVGGVQLENVGRQNNGDFASNYLPGWDIICTLNLAITGNDKENDISVKVSIPRDIRFYCGRLRQKAKWRNSSVEDGRYNSVASEPEIGDILEPIGVWPRFQNQSYRSQRVSSIDRTTGQRSAINTPISKELASWRRV